MYSGSNDISYMNHIVCRHYHANYRCGQCLNKVFTTGQQLKAHLKVCVGLPKEDGDHTPTLPEKEHTSKDPSPDSQLSPPQSSQGSSQVSPHQSQHSQKKKSASTPKKADCTTKSSKSSKEESRKKVSKKSKWDKCHNKEMSKKEKHQTKTRQTRANLASPARSESPPPTWVVHLLCPFFTVM